MEHFPHHTNFKFSWRKYQERVLSELETHLDDEHLHVIAPPGSGKTVLGLEVATRLNKPTLILAPTVAIRNQWIQRFTELFLQVTQSPEWISRDLKSPKFLTVSTYQALHIAMSDARAEETISLLRGENIQTIVIDEAHHLKNAWWKSLTQVKEELKAVVVGLTATPPYDVNFTEWQRYLELNGPVDTEISVPELVVEGDLCPHQDYVYLSSPTVTEFEKIEEYRDKIKVLYNQIRSDSVLQEAIENFPVFLNPADHLDWIYDNLEIFSSILIYLNALEVRIEKEHFKVLGIKRSRIPELDMEWFETLLNFYLFNKEEYFTQYKEHREQLSKKLKRAGAIEFRSVNFKHNAKVNKFLTSSISKLESIRKIVEHEHSNLGSELRLVVLTDYIRKEFMSNGSENNLELNKIGVLPIFEKLRRTNHAGHKIGVLTGSLVIIPAESLDTLKAHGIRHGISEIKTIALTYDENYLIVQGTEQIKHDIVHIVTTLFQEGELQILIGTKSLLGEGWDAPAINSLILASFVGSFVLSNQMRGRAIRAERGNPDKTGNIWHLVCTDPSAKDGGDDYQLLNRRFKAFVGLSFREEHTIENGLTRLGLPIDFHPTNDTEALNTIMLQRSGERDTLKRLWAEALKSGNTLIEEIAIPFPKEKGEYKKAKSMYFYKTMANFFGFLGSALIGSFEALPEFIFRNLRRVRSYEDFYMLFIAFVGGLLIAFGRSMIKAGRMYFKYRDISKDLQKIGEALLSTLINNGSIKTDKNQLKVIASQDKFGGIYCHLEGGSTFEKSTFIAALQEIVAVVDKSRFIIIRKSKLLKIIAQKDYHAVPEIIARRKNWAQYFANEWKRMVGYCELVNTRTPYGRKILLKSRFNSLASEFDAKPDRRSVWRK